MPNDKPLKLTKTQVHASQSTVKRLLVSAGAGTGKTRVLVERYLNLIVSGQASVNEILALTFTEKAANEMKARILKELTARGRIAERRQLESAYISTIHAFCARLLREHPLEAGLDPNFRVIESDEAAFLKDQALDEALDEFCELGNDVFLLIQAYGENVARDGILKVAEMAKHEAKALDEFLSVASTSPVPASPASLFEQTDAPEFAQEWEHFDRIDPWDWETVEAYKTWKQKFSRKRKQPWGEIKDLCDRYLGYKLDSFLTPWKKSFETLALKTEAIYEAKKKERAFLDFDDLQIRVVELFRSPSKMHMKLLERYRQQFRHILVDEFQDTNFVQLALIELLSEENNLFYVGDFKQSIYRFRGAEPDIFRRMEGRYRDQKEGEWIPLLENFRTAPGLLNFINDFFEGLWEGEENVFQALIPRVEENPRAGAEIIIVSPEGPEDDLDMSRMQEAGRIAGRILQLREEGYAYGDMAVLFQAMNKSGIYEQALRKHNIPYYILSGGGFYHQPEVRDMICFLSFLENPLADIPLAATLRSPLVQLSDDALFWLAHEAKSAAGDGGNSASLFEGVKRYEGISGIADEQKSKIAAFLKMTGDLLAVKDRLKLTELMDRVFEATAYELRVLADPQGVRRLANLKKMVNIARRFEDIEPLPLAAFLKTIKRLQNQEARETEAQVEAEQSGEVVRLMTVHRSKGLEFPVVFVADLAHKKQAKESTAVLAQPVYGYGMKVKNEISRKFEEPSTWKAIYDIRNVKEREEWKRLFYVAATRAKEKLILTGVARPQKKAKEGFDQMSSWMEWLTAVKHEGLAVQEGPQSLPKKRKLAAAERKDLHAVFGHFDPVQMEKSLGKIKGWEKIKKNSHAFMAGLEPKPVSPARVIDLPVSAYTAFASDPARYWEAYEMGRDPLLREEREAMLGPQEAEESGLSASEFGKSMHLVMENLDFEQPVKSGDFLIKRIFKHAPQGDRNRAKTGLSGFLKSALFKRIAKAKRVYRELPFVLNERHGLIHGVIDLLFEEAGGAWHLVDYKTGSGDTAKLKSSGYETQLHAYALAIEALLGTPPRSASLFFMENQWEYKTVFKKEDFNGMRERIQEIQERILSGPALLQDSVGQT